MSDRSSTSAPPEQPLAPRFRAKRAQVARACDGCRLHRIKCDNNVPCLNCKEKGRACSKMGAAKTSTVSQAQDEISRLRRQVHDLEAKLQQTSIHDRVPSEEPGFQQLTPPYSSPSQISSISSIETSQEYAKTRPWGGIQLRPARTPHKTWYGASSLYYFIQRLDVYLSSVLQQVQATNKMLPPSANSQKLFERTAAEPKDPASRLGPSRGEPSSTGVYLSPIQEDYFMNLYWQTSHTCLFPIIDESDFKQHYQSLWTSSATERAPSALVDILVALCMQHGTSALPCGRQGSIAENDDATIAGRWHFRRGQSLLQYELETPTISTLQCHLLSVAYLCGGSFHNMVDGACVLAVRIAYMLGIHLEPPADMPERERQLRKRLWWAVHHLDSKVGMKLGRPFTINDSLAMPELPGDDLKAAAVSGSTFAPVAENVTWLSYSIHNFKLYAAVRAAHNAFYNKNHGLSSGQTIWEDAKSLETYAETLTPYVKELEQWANGVPTALQTRRQSGESPYSTEISALEIEQFAPAWLQRQRILLELTFHHLSVNLYRPFISFSAAPFPNSLAEGLAVKCALHAIAVTTIVHQALSSTTILDGWHEAYQWQWNATMTLVGFMLVYPNAKLTPIARANVDLGVAVFDKYGANFAMAAAAADIMRGLLPKVDMLAPKFSAGNAQDTQGQSYAGSVGPTALDGVDFTMENDNYALGDGMGFDLFDMALDVDFWGDTNTLWPDAGNFLQYGQT